MMSFSQLLSLLFVLSGTLDSSLFDGVSSPIFHLEWLYFSPIENDMIWLPV